MASKQIEFKIDMLPVSENKAVRMSSRGGYKTKEYKEWEEFVLLTVNQKQIKNSEWYRVDLLFYYPLYFKNGNIRNKDAHNMIKYAVDTVLHNKVVDEDGEKIDDRRVLMGTWEKKDGKDQHVVIKISPVK